VPSRAQEQISINNPKNEAFKLTKIQFKHNEKFATLKTFLANAEIVLSKRA
jgi:TRAP-type uncharacterized transport system substrate-binding protein